MNSNSTTKLYRYLISSELNVYAWFHISCSHTPVIYTSLKAVLIIFIIVSITVMSVIYGGGLEVSFIVKFLLSLFLAFMLVMAVIYSGSLEVCFVFCCALIISGVQQISVFVATGQAVVLSPIFVQFCH